MNENKHINYLIMHALCTRRNLQITSEAKRLFEKLHDNLNFYQSLKKVNTNYITKTLYIHEIIYNIFRYISDFTEISPEHVQNQ